MRRTKIVCTLGPATDTKEVLRELLIKGMDVARFNFSHGSHEEHLKRLNLLRETANEMSACVAVMLDTKGPEIRLGLFEGGKSFLDTGSRFVLTTRNVSGNASQATVSYKEFPHAVAKGDFVYLDDGNVILEVLEVNGHDTTCEVVDGGPISDRKKVNLPGIPVDLPPLTEKDVADIQFAIQYDFDYIAASFVRSSSDVLEIRKLLEEHDSGIKIISKIENEQGVERMREILQVSDGFMVARGDLGVEIPPEEVPLIQKEMIGMCNEAGKPVITATQMLDSMIRNPRPTRAEASDVANAILDGTDAIMLSGETAAGKFPIEAVQMMHRIAVNTEKALSYRTAVSPISKPSVTEAIGQAVCRMSTDLNADAIITPTESGYTARMIAKHRPASNIIAVTPHASIVRELKLCWGVIPVLGSKVMDTDEVLEHSVGIALANDLIENGDLVVITAGVPVGRTGSTNLIKVHTVGKVVARGTGIGKESVTGTAFVARSAEEISNMPPGSILVCESTDKSYVSSIGECIGVVTECGGLTSHGAIVCLHMNIPVIVGAEDVCTLMRTGDRITLDVERGLVYMGEATVL